MSVEIVIGGNPKLKQGKLDAGGGKHLDRIQEASLSWVLIPERAGTRATALQIDVSRDASQGSRADLLAYQIQFGTGRAEKNAVKVQVFLIDDERKGKPALIGKFECDKAVIVGTRISNNGGEPIQEVSLRASEFKYFNAISGKYEPSEPNLVPVHIDGFVEDPDGGE